MIIINKLITLFPILFYPFINIVVLFILGFGLTFLILPKSLRSYWLWLSPWTTIITAIFYFVITSLFGLSTKQTFIPYIIICLVAGVYVLVKIKPIIIINKKEDFILVILIIFALILNLSPLIRRDKMLTSVSMGNNDVIAYVATGDYLKNYSIGESFKTKVDLAVGTLLQGGYRWGTPIINSFFLTLLNLEGYQYTYISQAVLFSLFIPLSYILFKIIFGPSTVGLIIISIFTGFNINLLYILYHDFFGQILFWGIEMLLFIFFYSYFDSKEIKSKKLNIYDLILGILTTVLFFSYHEPAIFIFAPLGIFLLIILFKKKKYFKNYFFALLRIAFISIITGATSIAHAMIADFQQAFMGNPNQPIGWQLFRSKIPFANPFEAMGFWSIHNFEPMPTILAIALSMIVILIIIKGVLKSRYKILTISYLLIFSLFYYWTAISQHNFFSYNRALTYTLPFIIVLFSIGLTNLYEKQKYFWLIIITILISLVSWSAVNLNKRFIREHLSVDKSFISILDIKRKNINEPIYAESYVEDATPLWKQIWINYFLYLKGVSAVPTVLNDGQFENKVPNDSLILISKPTPWFSARKIIFNDIIWSNNYYKLGHICNTDDCLMKSKYKLDEIIIGKNEFEDSLLINGWNIGEGENRWANEKESTLRLITKENYPISLTVEALSLSKPQEMTVYLNEKLLGKILIGTEWKNYSLPINYPLNFGVHKLKFVYSQGFRPIDVIPGNLDGRTLYVNFKKISLE